SELGELTGLVRGELRIGGMYPTGPYDLAEMLAEFRRRHPGVAINMVEDTQDDLLARLRADELDCAFTAVEPDTLGDEYAATLIWEEEFVVALPAGHPLTGRDHVTFEQLAGEDLIAYRENSALRRRLERTMADRGLAPRNAFICTEMAAVRALVGKGLGLAVMPRSVAEQEGPPIAVRPIGPERHPVPDRTAAIADAGGPLGAARDVPAGGRPRPQDHRVPAPGHRRARPRAPALAGAR